MGLLVAAFRELRSQHEAARVADPIDPSDPAHRIHIALLGLISEHQPQLGELRSGPSRSVACPA